MCSFYASVFGHPYGHCQDTIQNDRVRLLTMTFMQPFSALANLGNKVTFLFTRFISNIKVVKDTSLRRCIDIFSGSPIFFFVFSSRFRLSSSSKLSISAISSSGKYPLDVQHLQKLAKVELWVLRERLTSASYIQSIKSHLFQTMTTSLLLSWLLKASRGKQKISVLLLFCFVFFHKNTGTSDLAEVLRSIRKTSPHFRPMRVARLGCTLDQCVEPRTPQYLYIKDRAQNWSYLARQFFLFVNRSCFLKLSSSETFQTLKVDIPYIAEVIKIQQCDNIPLRTLCNLDTSFDH